MTFWRKVQACAAAVGAVLVLAWAGVVGLGVAATLTLGVVVLVADTPFTPRGRLRRENGRDGWATARDLLEARPKGQSVRLGRTTVGPRAPVPVRVSHEESVLILGGPRKGKTLALADIVRQHRGRGPRYVSSTRFDLLRTTIGARRRGEPPAWVFAPEGVGGATGALLALMIRARWVREMRWSPVDGCSDPEVAANRAAALIEAIDAGSAEDQTWLQSATTVLRGCLRAAALGRLSMAEVYEWVTGPGTVEPFTLLEKHGAKGWANELRSELMSVNERGAASVLRNVRQACEFMANASVAAACCPGSGDAVLDVHEFLAGDETLYVIGRERKRQGTQPLMAALTTHLYETAVAVADTYEDGKLPRRLQLAADELKVTARVPWDEWLATAAGSGIHMVGVAQSPAQLREKWGEHGSAAILDNSGCLLVFGGLKGDDDLRSFAELCGERAEPIPGDQDGRMQWRPVMSKARLSGLRKFRALYLGGGMARPTIVGTARWVKVAQVAGAAKVAVAAAAASVVHTDERPQLETRRQLALPPAPPRVEPPARKPERAGAAS